MSEQPRGPVIPGVAMVLIGGALGLALGAGLFFAAQHGARTSAEVPKGAATVAARGFTLASVKVRLPDATPYPAGPGADVMNANCTACHSPEMVLTQSPTLTPAQWAAEVDKMRGTYKASIDDKDVPAILAYLTGPKPAWPGG